MCPDDIHAEAGYDGGNISTNGVVRISMIIDGYIPVMPGLRAARRRPRI
jgi:hypothetical protein